MPPPPNVTHPCFTPGAAWRQVTVTRHAAYQASRLEACGVDPARWAGVAEPTLFGNDNFRLLSAEGAPIDGFVHMAQRLRQTRPIALGETLTLKWPLHARRSATQWRLFYPGIRPRRQRRPGGPDSRASPAETGAEIGGPETRRPIAAGDAGTPEFAEVAGRAMTPEAVTLFSSDVGNLLTSIRISLRPWVSARQSPRA